MSGRLLLFGSPTVVRAGESFALPCERRTQLLAFLALRRAWVGRAELAALLWPEQPGKLAYTNLRKTLFRLQSLPWAPRVESQGGALRFEAENDVFDFETALREGKNEEALRLRRGELLAGFEDDANEAWSSWLNFERDRLRAAWRSAALERLAGDIDAVEGTELSARLLDADPLDEAALRSHLSWLARSGHAARARQAYREFVDRLQRELGLAPSVELKALHDGLGAASAPVQASRVVAAPAGDPGFVGRTTERRRIEQMLAREDCRLLTLVGPGGVGKTRLARRVLSDLAAGYADGAAFIPLEDIAVAGEIGGRLARELATSLASRGEPLDQVIAFLGGRQMLLVLDNFEQLAADAALVDRLLQSCPKLKLIVTSRVRLALAGEWVLPLDGLPCPEIEDQDRIEAFDAARLFIETARRFEPALLPATESAAIVEICQLVGGLPLALQLAAAWTRLLSCDAIAAELRQGTELLRAVDPAHPPRHASFAQVFDQSWRLLSPVEREALARLSVFRGGFTAEAAKAVTAASLPVLGALADKSLLRKDGGRLQMHPLVHQLAAARLADGAALAETQAAHAAYFLNLLVQLRLATEDGDPAGLKTIDAEFENCRLAWHTALAQGQGDLLRRCVRTLLNYSEHRARFDDGLALVRQAADAALGARDAGLRALMLSQASFLEYRLDRYDEARATAERALAVPQAARDRETKAQALKVLACCAMRGGRFADARRLFKQALAQAPAEVLAHDTAATLDNLALVEKRMGNYQESLRLSMESLTQHRRIGDNAGVALCLNNLGSMYLFLNDTESAAAHLSEALALSERHGLVSTRSFALANLTELALKRRDYAAARIHARRALEISEATGIRAVSGWLKVQLARVAAAGGELAESRDLLAAAAGLAVTLGAPAMKAAVLLGFAELLEAQGQAGAARRVLAFGMDEPTISAPDREELRAEWSRRANGLPPESPPSLALDELLNRVVIESGAAHAGLIRTLEGAH